MISKVFEKIQGFALLLAEYIKYKRLSRAYNATKSFKVLILDLEHPIRYRRYLYNLIKFFSIQGYTVYFPRLNIWFYRKRIFGQIHDGNFRQIFEDGLIVFGQPKMKNNEVIKLTDQNIDPDYFSSLFTRNKDSHEGIHVPMAMHPNMYRFGLWDEHIEVDNDNRMQSLIMIGLFGDKYRKFDQSIFQIENRLDVYQHLKHKNISISFDTLSDFYSFIESENDFSCIILNRWYVNIPMKELRQVLSRFSFYLALPGFFMPLSHNLIEAISVGAIPVLHTNYARLMAPPFQHMKNAILYDDLYDLEEKIQLCFTLSDKKIASMREEVYAYYNAHMTPRAVVEKLSKNEDKVNYLLAGKDSVRLLKRQRKKTPNN